MAIPYVFYSVNEEGATYDRHDSVNAALLMLASFPNDSVVIVTAGSPGDREYGAAFIAHTA